MTLQEAVDKYGAFDWTPNHLVHKKIGTVTDVVGECPAEAHLEIKVPGKKGIELALMCGDAIEVEGWTMTAANVLYVTDDWTRVREAIFKSGYLNNNDGTECKSPEDVSVEAWLRYKESKGIKFTHKELVELGYVALPGTVGVA
jgi:hypothetical protein